MIYLNDVTFEEAKLSLEYRLFGSATSAVETLSQYTWQLGPDWMVTLKRARNGLSPIVTVFVRSATAPGFEAVNRRLIASHAGKLSHMDRLTLRDVYAFIDKYCIYCINDEAGKWTFSIWIDIHEGEDTGLRIWVPDDRKKAAGIAYDLTAGPIYRLVLAFLRGEDVPTLLILDAIRHETDWLENSGKQG